MSSTELKEKEIKDKLTAKINEFYKIDFTKLREINKILLKLYPNNKNLEETEETEESSINEEKSKLELLNFNVLGDTNLIPKYTIVAFDTNNKERKIPTGWAICDGSTVKDIFGNDFKTPNLQKKFIIGTNNLKNIGKDIGNESVLFNAGNLQRHNHGENKSAQRNLQKSHGHTFRDNYYSIAYSRGSKDRRNVATSNWYVRSNSFNSAFGGMKSLERGLFKVPSGQNADRWRDKHYNTKQNSQNAYHIHSQLYIGQKSNGKPIKFPMTPPHFILIYIIKI